MQKWPHLVWTWQDAQNGPAVFRPGRGVLQGYARALRNYAKTIGDILKGNSPLKAEDLLQKYAETSRDWARELAARMIHGLDRNNRDQFIRQARRMGFDMRIFLASPGMGETISRQIENNTKLIVTIPQNAAKKAGELAHESLIMGLRSEETAKRLHALGAMTERRARVIAHTETSKAYTALTQTRAQSVGSEGYIWRTGRDGAVRPSHRAMEGKFVKWTEPPTLDKMTGHAGEFPNCRCHPEPVIPRADGTTRPFFQGLPTQKEEKESGKLPFKSYWEKTVGADLQNTTPFIPHEEGKPLFNVEKAFFEPKKLTGYSLNPDSERGAHKARVWKATIGATLDDAADIERQVMSQLWRLPAHAEHKPLEHGEKFTVLVPVKGPNGKTIDVITAWMYDRWSEEIDGKKVQKGLKTIPRLTTIYVDPKSKARYE